MLLTKVFFYKKMKKWLYKFIIINFCFYSIFHWGNTVKSESFEKNTKKGLAIYRDFYRKGGFKPSAKYAGIKYFDFIGSKETDLFLETRLNPIDKLQWNRSKVVANVTRWNSLDNVWYFNNCMVLTGFTLWFHGCCI